MIGESRLQLPRSFCKTPATTIPSQSRKVIVFIVANQHVFFKGPSPLAINFIIGINRTPDKKCYNNGNNLFIGGISIEATILATFGQFDSTYIYRMVRLDGRGMATGALVNTL